MDEQQVNVTIEPTEDFDPVAEIQALRANSVPKTEYEKAVADKNKYLKALIDGAQIETPAAETVDVEALRAELFGGEELDNLTYCKKALELRNALIEQQGIDIFVGSGSKLTPTDADYIAAQRVADAMQSCIDAADGNSSVFTAKLMSITNDVKLLGNINPKIKR